MTTHLIPLTQPELWLKRGHAYPSTTNQWRALYRDRHRNGLETAFVRAGSRILVDEERFVAALRHRAHATDTQERRDAAAIMAPAGAP